MKAGVRIDPLEATHVDGMRASGLWDEHLVRHVHADDPEAFGFAAIDDGVVFGVIAVVPRTLPAPLQDQRDAFIDILWLLDEWQRQGIGTALLYAAEDEAHARRYFQIRAWSSEDKVGAIRFFHRHGYSMAPTRIKHETVGGYISVKRLTFNTEGER